MGQTRDERWGADLGRRIALAARAHRERRGWSVETLSRRCETVGWPTSRSKLANLENGARSNVTLQEVFALAAALAVPPAALLFGDDMYADVEVLPGVKMSTLDAVSWFAAADPSLPAALPRAAGDADYHGEVAGRFMIARIIAEHVAEIDQRRGNPAGHRQALDDLAERLDAMRALGLDADAPPLPERIVTELAEVARPASSRLIPREHRRRVSTGGTA